MKKIRTKIKAKVRQFAQAVARWFIREYSESIAQQFESVSQEFAAVRTELEGSKTELSESLSALESKTTDDSEMLISAIFSLDGRKNGTKIMGSPSSAGYIGNSDLIEQFRSQFGRQVPALRKKH